MQNASDSNNLIVLSDVSKTYPAESVTALSHVSFTVTRGEFVCIIGPSGCGKTTVLKIIAGLEKPTGGSVVRPPSVAMTFQSGALFPWLSAFDNVALVLRKRNFSREQLEHHVDAQLRMVNMLEYKHKLPAELSGGQRQRVGIARALAIDPAVLLMDEPFSALDAKTTSELHDDLIGIWRQTHKTIVVVSHLIEEAVSLANQVILMKNGAIENSYQITLPYPRREQAVDFSRDVMRIRSAFFR